MTLYDLINTQQTAFASSCSHSLVRHGYVLPDWPSAGKVTNDLLPVILWARGTLTYYQMKRLSYHSEHCLYTFAKSFDFECIL